jgi:glycosyltransferase involved in cell wall biosynthesis
VPSIPKGTYQAANKEPGHARFVFLSRIVEKKNLLVALSALQNVSGDVVFDIYGPIEDERYWASCQQIIDDMPENVRVNYCGLVTHDEVHKIFSLYDAFVFPTQSENFGHVIAEALSVGTYAIISDQTPFSDLETYSAGKALSLVQPSAFSEAMQEVVEWDDKQACLQRDNAKIYLKDKLNLQQLKDQYGKIFC